MIIKLAEGRAATHQPTRGVVWVLRSASAIAVLCATVTTIAEFGCCLMAEQAATRAVRAGALEATLPRASLASIAASVQRRLGEYPRAIGQSRITVSHNGTPARKGFAPLPDDRIAVTLTVPAEAVLPRWLHRLNFWHDHPPIIATAERRMPGRRIAQNL